MSTIVLGVTFAVETCCVAGCGLTFAMDAEFQRQRRADKASFYCPRGHAQHYPAKSEEQKLREELAAEQRRVQLAREATERANRRATSAEMSRRVTKGHLTRIKKRVGAGVCPACQRTVKQLAAHMKCKHPGYGTSPTTPGET